MLSNLVEEQKKMMATTVDEAYDDPDLVGGGVSRLETLLRRELRYCDNPAIDKGRHVCGRLMNDNFDGHTCPNCGAGISKLVDHVIDLSELYPLLMEHSDLLQRIADYYPISRTRLSQPPHDKQARVWCTESGFVARRDFHQHPKNFELDIVPLKREKAYYQSHPDVEAQLCVVVEAKGPECKLGMYTVQLIDGQLLNLYNEDRSKVQKIGGVIPVNVIVFDDGAEVYSNLQYSNESRTEEIQNIHWKYRRMMMFSSFLGTTSGGGGHPNVREKNAWYEKQRRRMSAVGSTCQNPLTCQYAGRKVTVHQCSIKRNEYQRTLDHPVAMKQGTMGLRNIYSMNPFLFGFKAMSSSSRSSYSSCLNTKNCTPITERESNDLFATAEKLHGEEGWLGNAQRTGVKCQTVAEAGAPHHDLEPDPTQNNWSRVEFGSMHFLGIVDNSFREFVLAVASVAARRTLSVAPHALRQMPGTKKFHTYVKRDRVSNTAAFTAVDEKLHQKQKWRRTLMLYDLKPLFKGDSNKTRDMHQVATSYLTDCFVVKSSRLTSSLCFYTVY